MKNFRTLTLAKQLFKAVREIRWSSTEFKNQLHQASLRIVVNIVDGSNMHSVAARQEHYLKAQKYLRRAQALLEVTSEDAVANKADQLGASLHCLIQNPGQFRQKS